LSRAKVLSRDIELRESHRCW